MFDPPGRRNEIVRSAQSIAATRRTRRRSSMATRSGGSRSGRSSGSRSGAKRRAGSGRTGSARRSTAATRGDKGVEAFRDALERSVTLSRDRLQEVMDDAVRRGRMTRRRRQRARQQPGHPGPSLHRRPGEGARAPARPGATRARVANGVRPDGAPPRPPVEPRVSARDAADSPLAQADRLRRRAGVSAGGPITAYDQLTASQIKSRLGDLSAAELRQLRDREKRGKARKGVLGGDRAQAQVAPHPARWPARRAPPRSRRGRALLRGLGEQLVGVEALAAAP